MNTSEQQRYRFGPLERRGLIGSLRAPQVAVLAASLTAGVILMRTLAGGAGIGSAVVLALAATLVCFWPVSGRSAEEWLPIVGRYLARRAPADATATSRPRRRWASVPTRKDGPNLSSGYRSGRANSSCSQHPSKASGSGC
jgi:hypothetical protein